ncbi:MAG TPA: hypothetical protein ENK55_07275 [Actinobacteria bacterium]|nr:hypothetical protein [Actinomycetota bacterium]
MSKVDWAVATAVGSATAGRHALEGGYHMARFARRAPGIVAEASALVAEETGLSLPGVPEVAVISRAEWVELNVRSFARLLAPVEARLAEQPGFGRAVASRLVGVELGAVLGFLARRVLGQYELVLPTGDDDHGDTLVFVGGNVLDLERRFEFRPREFRFWVALHEATHRAQFVGVPWMRDHFLGLVAELLDAARPEPGRLARVARELRDAAKAGRPVVGDTGLFGLLVAPDRRPVLDRIQALMTLLEGHGHVVMDRIGERMLVGQTRMSRMLASRRADPRTQALLRLVGLEMKLRQYEEGARFVTAVEREAGFAALEAAWRGPEYLPSLAEIAEPRRWLERVA